jgi:broad specificity phosphatase PhoE
MIKIFLARHASPDWSRNDLPYHLPPGPSLTAQGADEAYALAEFFHQAGVRQLYVSPLERCLQTARIIVDSIGASQVIIPALIEVQPGETTDDLRSRLWPVFEQAYQSAATHGPTALITHGSPIAILLALLGLKSAILQNYQIYDNKNVLPPGGSWQANQITPEGPWELKPVFPPPINSKDFSRTL